jgi:hypothetical protein
MPRGTRRSATATTTGIAATAAAQRGQLDPLCLLEQRATPGGQPDLDLGQRDAVDPSKVPKRGKPTTKRKVITLKPR